MKIVERDADGKGGILEVTEEDYRESLAMCPNRDCDCHMKPGRYPFRRGGFTPDERRQHREIIEARRKNGENR